MDGEWLLEAAAWGPGAPPCSNSKSQSSELAIPAAYAGSAMRMAALWGIYNRETEDIEVCGCSSNGL